MPHECTVESAVVRDSHHFGYLVELVDSLLHVFDRDVDPFLPYTTGMTPEEFFPIDETGIETILSRYDIGALESHRILPKGENVNVLLETKTGRYHLKLYIQENSERRNFILYELLLMRHLIENAIEVPRVVRTSDGAPYTEYRGRICTICSAIDGSEEYILDRDSVGQVGELLGRFHGVSKGYRGRYGSVRGKFTPRILHADLLRDYLVLCGNDELKARIIDRSRFIRKLRYGKLPAGAIHGDVDPQNFLFKDGELKAMIDFGDSLPGPLIIDVARGVYEFCLSSGLAFNRELFEAFVGRYDRRRPLTEGERNMFGEFVRFVYIWKITDGLRSGKPDGWLCERLDTMDETVRKTSLR